MGFLDHITVKGDTTYNNVTYLSPLQKIRKIDSGGKCFLIAFNANPETIDNTKPIKIVSPSLNSAGELNFISYNKENITGYNNVLPDFLSSEFVGETKPTFKIIDGNANAVLYYDTVSNIHQELIDVNTLNRYRKTFTPLACNLLNLASTGFSDLQSFFTTVIPAFNVTSKYALIGGYSTDDIALARIYTSENNLVIPFIPANSFDDSPNFFYNISRRYGIPAIPVIDFMKWESVSIDALLNYATLASSYLTLNFVELK